MWPSAIIALGTAFIATNHVIAQEGQGQGAGSCQLQIDGVDNVKRKYRGTYLDSYTAALGHRSNLAD